MPDGKQLDKAAMRGVLPLGGRRPSQQLEHLFRLGDNNEALLEEKRLEEEQKLKEYRAATKEVRKWILLNQQFFKNALTFYVRVFAL